MGIWQRAMIALATNGRLRDWMQRRRVFSELSTRFVGGRDVSQAIERARDLAAAGRRSSLFYLGEYVADPTAIESTVAAYLAIVPALASAGLDVHVSVDPTGIGWMIGEDACRANAFSIARAVAMAASDPAVSPSSPERRSLLMLDMEDSSVTDATIRLYESLREAGLPAAVTLQAYLHRFEGDIRRCIVTGGAMRLVKGALAEPPATAATSRDEIDRRYLIAATLMLSPESRALGFYPIFATHDVEMIRIVRATAKRNGWRPGEYEFEMLYGVRPRLQDALVAREERLRLYLPFGHDWWPYAVRRVGENRRNVGLLAKALLARRRV